MSHLSKLEVPIIVPRRADGGVRDRLWGFCKQWWDTWLPRCPVIESSTDHEHFNRSAAINEGITHHATDDVVLVMDADVVCDVDQVSEAVAMARTTGRLCFAFDDYVALGREMTGRVLDGYDGDWSVRADLRMKGGTHQSSVLAVPIELWSWAGGFDERFERWGYDDSTFASACRALGGGVDRVPGTVFHLWHPASPDRDLKGRWHQCQRALARRYYDAEEAGVAAMASLIDERKVDDAVVLVITTDGRRIEIERCIRSITANVRGPITRRVISDDSGDREYRAWLRRHFDDFEVIPVPKPRGAKGRAGFTANVASAWEIAAGSGQRWAFWVEDDFTFTRTVDLRHIAATMRERPDLMQMSLKRQAWFPHEVEAGGLLESFGADAFTPRRSSDGHRWLEHELYFTTNPSLIPRKVLIEHPWPSPRVRWSEANYSKEMLRAGWRSGIWGTHDDDPWCIHDGERSGVGY